MSTGNSSRKVNVAVVGLGFMGTVHLRTYLKNPFARVIAVCDQTRVPSNGILPAVSGNISTADDAIDLGKDIRVYQKFDELLADPDVHLVDLCTPTLLHPEQSIAALAAGKHVLCEKPVARTSSVARQIVEAAGKARGIFMPAMCMRFWPGWSLLKQVVDEQPYGKVLAARFSRLSETPGWSRKTFQSSDAGGALFDLHIHDSDFVQFLFGKPVGVFSTGIMRAGTSIDHVVTQYRFANGPAVSAEGSWLLMKGFRMTYTVNCERATLDFDSTRTGRVLEITEEGRAPRVIPTDGDGYTGEIAHVLESIVGGTRPTIVTAPDGQTALEICEAEEKSVLTGEFVRV